MTAPTVASVPNKPKTPMHSFRAPEDLWERAKVKAAEKGVTITDVLVKALEDFADEK